MTVLRDIVTMNLLFITTFWLVKSNVAVVLFHILIFSVSYMIWQ